MKNVLEYSFRANQALIVLVLAWVFSLPTMAFSAHVLENFSGARHQIAVVIMSACMIGIWCITSNLMILLLNSVRSRAVNTQEAQPHTNLAT